MKLLLYIITVSLKYNELHFEKLQCKHFKKFNLHNFQKNEPSNKTVRKINMI